MSKNKYCYAVVDKENGSLLRFESQPTLSIYYKKEIAQGVVKNFTGFVIQPILLEDMERFIIHPDSVNYRSHNIDYKI